MYEAAALDNASRWTTLWRITVPALRRTIVLVIMLQTAAQLQLFGQAQLLTAGGPSGASRTAVLFLFETAFGQWELGYAARLRRSCSSSSSRSRSRNLADRPTPPRKGTVMERRRLGACSAGQRC